MSANSICERLSFFFGVGTDFFVEIAKLRAARLVCRRLPTHAGLLGEGPSLRMHCQTSGGR